MRRACSAGRAEAVSDQRDHWAQEKGGRRGRLILPFAYPLLTEMHPSILAAERRARLTDKPVRSAVAMIVRIVIGVSIAAERRGRDGARGANGVADNAGRYVSRPESAIAMLDHACGFRVMARDPRA